MKLLFAFVFTLFSFGDYEPCQLDRFIQATDETTDQGRAFTDAIDADASLIDDWEKLDNADIRNIESQFTTLETEQIGPYLKDISDNIPLARKFESGEISVNAWETANDLGIDNAIRENPEYLKTIDKFPFGRTSKKTILDNANDQEWDHLLSGKLVDVPETDINVSNMLKDKFGPNTKTSKKYDTDPTRKEFDAVTDEFFIEHKEFTSNNRMSKSAREQMDFQMKSCKVKGKDNYLIVEGVKNEDYINRAIRKANDFLVNTKIEYNSVVIHDIKF